MQISTTVRFPAVARTLMAAAVLGCASLTASAQTLFFGEDTSADGSLPVPNSAAAEANFLSNLIGVQTEDFEAIPVGTQFPIAVMFGSDVATLNGTHTVSNTGVQNTPIGGRFAISGIQYLNVGTADAGSFNLTFSAPQAAFGFYATDIGDVAGQLTVSLDGGPAIVVPHTVNAPDGGALFFGIIDVNNPFTTVTFANATGDLSDAFGFDDFTIGRREQVAQVPEPSSVAFLGMGTLMVAGLARRRSRRNRN